MTDPKDAAIHFEANKVAFKQDKNGFSLTLGIHPNEVKSALTQHPIGQRYIVAIVAIGDDEQPLTTVQQQTGMQRVRQAALLCKDQLFQKYMFEMGYAADESEESAAEALRVTLGVKTRAEISENETAQHKLQAAFENFRRWRDGGKRL